MSLINDEFQPVQQSELQLTELSIEDSSPNSSLFSTLKREPLINPDTLLSLNLSGKFGLIEHWRLPLARFRNLKSLVIFPRIDKSREALRAPDYRS
jgi:hypothetical protein